MSNGPSDPSYLSSNQPSGDETAGGAGAGPGPEEPGLEPGSGPGGWRPVQPPQPAPGAAPGRPLPPSAVPPAAHPPGGAPPGGQPGVWPGWAPPLAGGWSSPGAPQPGGPAPPQGLPPGGGPGYGGGPYPPGSPYPPSPYPPQVPPSWPVPPQGYGYPGMGVPQAFSSKLVPALICAILSIAFAFCCGPFGIVAGSGMGIAAIVLGRRDREERARSSYPPEPADTLALILAILGLICSLFMFVFYLYLRSHPELSQQLFDMAKDMQR